MSAGTYGSTFRIAGLPSFLWTQFLGALNDNVYKTIVSFVAIQTAGWAQGMPLVTVAFVAPFLVCSGWSGHLADTWSKRTVLVVAKGIEILAMLLAIPALMSGRLSWLLAVLVLMGLQSTFFSPAKYGIVPELVPPRDLSRANGLLEMSTFTAIILGIVLGGELFERFADSPVILGSVLVTVAVVGALASLGIPRVAAAAPGQRFALNPFGEVRLGLGRLASDRTLGMTVLGISYFWLVGSLLYQVVIPWGQSTFGIGEAGATRLYMALAVGIGGGSLLAGRLSGDKVELGLVPIGAIGLGVFTLALAPLTESYVVAVMWLVLLGVAGGLFAVPLNALLQQRPDEAERGRVLATNNVLNTVGMLMSAAVLWLLGDQFELSLGQILVVTGVFTLVTTVYAVATLPDFLVRFTLWLVTHTIYRIRIVGRPNLPLRGPALIVANHVSMIDGALVGACIQRFVRFMVFGPIYRTRGLTWLFRFMRAIPVTGGNRREVLEAIGRARAELEAGHVVCIFAEGAVSRTGNLLPFKRGFERIVQGLDVPIVPVHLDRVWGSVFSFKGGRFIWKMPQQVPYPVTLTWGQPMFSSATASDVRQRIAEMGAEALAGRRPSTDRLHWAFLRRARRQWSALAMVDTTGQSLTFGRAAVSACALSRVVRRKTTGQQYVGLLLPASVGGALANIAVSLTGKVPVNLNFTTGIEAMRAAMAVADVRTILTSRRFVAKAGIAEMPEMLFLEDLREEISAGDKLRAVVDARVMPLAWLVGRSTRRGDDTATAAIIFSSGSTGVPKGVELTHANILANVDSLTQIFPIRRGDCFLGVLPLFHSFGFTGTMWFPLIEGSAVAYHPNPMDAKAIGELAARYKVTLLISTPTFCSAWIRRCSAEQFAHLRFAIVGAEKLREPLAREFREKYGIPLLEGYGCTEMAPVVAVNRPDVTDGAVNQTGTKPGSVGHPIPGVVAKIVDRDSGVDLPVGEEGLLLVRGPNRMVGYLHAPERTAEVIRDGWYVTGDIARIDEDGFIFITDRLSRFSKIGGEMVPHVRIEEAINGILGETACAVTAVPDESKGERLVAFYTRKDVAPEVLWARLVETDLPKLWIPRRDALIQTDEIPTLGTGKVDLRRVRELAASRVRSATGASRVGGGPVDAAAGKGV